MPLRHRPSSEAIIVQTSKLPTKGESCPSLTTSLWAPSDTNSSPVLCLERLSLQENHATGYGSSLSNYRHQEQMYDTGERKDNGMLCSRAIPCPRPSRKYEIAEELEYEMCEMCKMATWQMYHRIVSSRQARERRALETSPPPLDFIAAAVESENRDAATVAGDEVVSMLALSCEEEDDGAIFDMEI